MDFLIGETAVQPMQAVSPAIAEGDWKEFRHRPVPVIALSNTQAQVGILQGRANKRFELGDARIGSSYPLCHERELCPRLGGLMPAGFVPGCFASGVV